MNAKEAKQITQQTVDLKLDKYVKYVIKKCDKWIKQEAKNAGTSISFNFRDLCHKLSTYDYLVENVIDQVLKHYEELGYTIDRYGETYGISWRDHESETVSEKEE